MLLMAAAVASPLHAAQGGSKKPPVIAVAPEGETQEMVLADGTRAIGRVERFDGQRLTFRTNAGVVMQVEISQVVALTVVNGRVVNGEFWRADSNPTRLFFAPTGRSLKKGEAYLGVYEVLMPFVQVGLTDRISIGGGTPLFFIDNSDRPFWLTPKVQVMKRGSVEAAVGVLHISNVGDYSAGVAYGVVTSGSADSAVTIGVGYAYSRSDGEEDVGAAPVLMLGGEHRVSRKIKLVTENYIFPSGGLLSGGVRFMGENLSVDLGLVSPLNAGAWIAAPMVNFVWKF
ncbi:MAG: hypothetical protein ABI665_03925 [Vicinamibacterales bacterium]